MAGQTWMGLLVVGLFVGAGCLNAATTADPNALQRTGSGIRVFRDVPADSVYWLTDTLGNKVSEISPELAGELSEPVRVALSYTGKRGAEPNVGVTSSGSIFMTAGLSTMRSRDHGVTWEEVYHQGRDGVPGLNGSSDPMIWVDPVTDRIFTDHMFSLVCSNMAFSDDDGETWVVVPLACGIPVNDHQKWASAPWSAALPRPPAPAPQSVVYYCYNKLAGTFCAVSYNGGLRFQHDQPVITSQNSPCGGGINGHPAWAPDGTVYVPRTLGCNRPVVGVTEDNGLTWQVRVGPDTHGGVEIDPDVTVTPDGTAYMLYRGRDQFQYLVRSPDKFQTWEGPWRVSPNHLEATVFGAITSGDDGRVAMVYLGTEANITHPEDNPNKNPQFAPNGTKWNAYITYALNAADAEPVFATAQANHPDDPIQRGCVWLSGGGNPCRNMLDFIDLASDAEGRIFAAVTDGCTQSHANGECAFNETALDDTSRSRDSAVIVALSGPSLRTPGLRITTELAPAPN